MGDEDLFNQLIVGIKPQVFFYSRLADSFAELYSADFVVIYQRYAEKLSTTILNEHLDKGDRGEGDNGGMIES